MVGFKQRQSNVGRSYMPPKRKTLRLGPLGFDVAHGRWFPKSFLPISVKSGRSSWIQAATTALLNADEDPTSTKQGDQPCQLEGNVSSIDELA